MPGFYIQPTRDIRILPVTPHRLPLTGATTGMRWNHPVLCAMLLFALARPVVGQDSKIPTSSKAVQHSKSDFNISGIGRT